MNQGDAVQKRKIFIVLNYLDCLSKCMKKVVDSDLAYSYKVHARRIEHQKCATSAMRILERKHLKKVRESS